MHAMWKFARGLTLLACTTPSDLLALVLALPAWVRSGMGFRIRGDGTIWLLCPELSVAARTLGPSVIQIRDFDMMEAGSALVDHELAHVEQAQAAALLGAATSVVIWLEGRPWWGVLMPVMFAWLASAGAAYAVAWLRGERDVYRDAHIEEAARAAAGQD